MSIVILQMIVACFYIKRKAIYCLLNFYCVCRDGDDGWQKVIDKYKELFGTMWKMELKNIVKKLKMEPNITRANYCSIIGKKTVQKCEG